MKNILLITATIISLSAFSQTISKNFIDQNYIEVTGVSEMEVTPNEIYLKIVLNEKDFNGKKDLIDTEKLMIDKLKEINIDINKQLVVKDIASNFGYYWLNKSKITTIKEYQLLVNDAKTAGKVYSSLEQVGISNINIVKIDHSEMQKFKAIVKKEAIIAAKEKAKNLTTAIDQNIGKAIYIEESSPGIESIIRNMPGINSNKYLNRELGYFDKKEQEMNIQFDKLKLKYSILVRFEII